MTCKAIVEMLFETGLFSPVYKLLMVINCWVSGLISLDDAQALCTECGFTFTKPTATGQMILTDGASTPVTYTLVSLLTAYNASDYSKSDAVKTEVFSLIDTLKTNGYITADEQTALKGLTW